MSWIQTYTGKRFDLLDPKADAICLEDIAHALSMLCRFTGHVRSFYSVGQHSVWVARRVADLGGTLAEQRQALLHDATEAYLNDLAAPLKALVPDYKLIETQVWLAVCERFDLPFRLSPLVKRADVEALMVERRDLLGTPPARWDESLERVDVSGLPSAEPWAGPVARHVFMSSAVELGLLP